LFYRLNVIPFQVSPLRERLEDIPLLVEHFNHFFSSKYGKRAKAFEPNAIERLQNHVWFGNIRELKNTIERIVIMNAQNEISAEDLPELSSSSNELPSFSYRFPSFKEATDAYQREFILHKLEEAEGNISKAAELMGVDRSHLYRRMKTLGIQAK
jgi:two-component system, NtrC family, nitrogen regulation response regulator NtrX